MRTRRWQSRAALGLRAGVVLGLLALTLLVVNDGNATEDGPWTVSVLQPKGAWQDCFDHPAVEFGLQAPSLPAASAVATLRPGEPREAAELIAACLRSHDNFSVVVRSDSE